jgi:WD40 repeat protein
MKPQRLGKALHKKEVTSVAFSPDGKILASGSYDHTIVLWDVHDPMKPQRLGEALRGHERGVISVAFSPDGKNASLGQ